MKSIIKKIIPQFVWKTIRKLYWDSQRLFLDIYHTASFSNPVEWVKLFKSIRTIRPTYSMVPTHRLKVLYKLSKKINKENIKGDIIECGVYNGGSAAMMMIPQLGLKETRDIWLFDSFEGLPPPTKNDGTFEQENYYEGWCKGTIQRVEEIFKHFRIPEKRTHIVAGWFENTFPLQLSNINQIALLHIDADWYESVKICLETFYPKVSSGGYIEFDDYGKFSGCKKAIQEYVSSNNIKTEFITHDNGMYFKKP